MIATKRIIAMRQQWLWTIPLLLLASFLGARMLNADMLWFDESKTVLETGARHFGPYSFAEVWDFLAQYDPWQSPAYFLLLNFWARFVDWSDFAARALSLLIGVLSLAFAYRMGKDLAGQRVGLYTLAALLGSSLTIHYFHEMRPYTLYILMTCLSIWAYWGILSREKVAWWLYLWLFLGLTGLAYTHVLALLTAFGIGVYHLLFAPKNRKWLYASGVMLLSALAFLPWLTVIWKVVALAADDSRRQAVALFGWDVLEVLLRSFANGYGVALLLLLLGAALLDRRPSVWLVVVWLVVAVGAAFGISYLVPAFIHVRYLFSVWPALAFLMAVGLVKLSEKGLPALPILVLWCGIGFFMSLNTQFFESLPNSRYNIPREGFMQMVSILEDHAREQDFLVLHTAPPTEEWDSDDIFAYYFHEIAAPYSHMELIVPFPNHFTDAAYESTVNEVLADVPVVWTAIVPEQIYSRRRLAFFEALEQSHRFCQQVIERPDMDLRLYAQGNAAVIGAFNGDAVTVQALWEIPPQVSDRLELFLGINRSPDLPPDTYSISLQVLDDAGGLQAQADYGLSNNPFSCRWTSLDLSGLASGNYRVLMVVYNFQTGERMVSSTGDTLELGAFSLD
jgi:uncharacterized membrane protein